MEIILKSELTRQKFRNGNINVFCQNLSIDSVGICIAAVGETKRSNVSTMHYSPFERICVVSCGLWYETREQLLNVKLFVFMEPQIYIFVKNLPPLTNTQKTREK